jgi:hypothetical protein
MMSEKLNQKPTVGRIVHYRAKTRGYTLPAIVTATAGSLDPDGIAMGHIPALDSEEHVHLHVFTAGAQVGYQEFNVAPGDEPGQWSWPARN